MSLKNLVNNICESRYIVNIGCGDGITQDPLNIFNNDFNYRGLYIEGDKHKCLMAEKKVSSNYKILHKILTPNNVLEIFEQHNVPKNLDVLKIDIDGYDLAVIRQILLDNYTPKIIISEINEKIPPPIKFEVLFNESYSWASDHFFGYSLSQGYDFYNKNNYHILSLYDYNNVMCINKNIYDSNKELIDVSLPMDINLLYNEGYVKYKSNFPWNSDVDHWLSITDKNSLINEIKTYYGAGTNRHQTRKYIENIDYTIE